MQNWVPKGLASVMTQHPKWSRGITGLHWNYKKKIAAPKVMDLAVQTCQTSGWKGRWKVCPGSCFLSPPSTKNSGTNQPSKPRSWPRVTFPFQHLVARSIYKHGNRIAQGQPSQQKPRRIKLTQKKICSSPGISLWNWQNNCTQLSTSTATTSGSQSLQLQFWEFGPVSWAENVNFNNFTSCFWGDIPSTFLKMVLSQILCTDDPRLENPVVRLVNTSTGQPNTTFLAIAMNQETSFFAGI